MKGCVRGDDNQEAMDEILMDGESDNNVRTISRNMPKTIRSSLSLNCQLSDYLTSKLHISLSVTPLKHTIENKARLSRLIRKRINFCSNNDKHIYFMLTPCHYATFELSRFKIQNFQRCWISKSYRVTKTFILLYL